MNVEDEEIKGKWSEKKKTRKNIENNSSIFIPPYTTTFEFSKLVLLTILERV